MKPGRLQTMGFLAAGLLLLLTAGGLHEPLISARSQYSLHAVPPSETSPMVALTTVAFGGFRGLVADALWIRANTLQQEGQFFELVQLSRWISQLEPRIPEVWSFQSWNLAYNISVLFPDPKNRMRWVDHGIDLLREEGLSYNPRSPDLHRDIGWMFQHKIGMNFDQAHRYYKQSLAEEIETVLPDGNLPEGGISPESMQVLQDRFSLKPEQMQHLETLYGPLDWRIPETHSLYWSAEGLRVQRSPRPNLSLLRMKYQSLQSQITAGDLLRSPDEGTLVPLPRFDVIPGVLEELRTLTETPQGRILAKTKESALTRVLNLHLDYGNLNQAREIYTELAGQVDELPAGEQAFQTYAAAHFDIPPPMLQPPEAMIRVVALIRRSMKLESSNAVRARGLLQVAQQVHRLYQQGRSGPDHLERTGLPPFETLVSTLRAHETRAKNF